jgi:signal peptidase I
MFIAVKSPFYFVLFPIFVLNLKFTTVFLLYFLIISYVLLCFSLSMLFPKAGVASSKAWIPGVNFIEWCKLIGKKPIEALWLLFPIVNIFTFTAMAVDLVRSFGKHGFGHSAAAVLYAPAIFTSIAKDDKAKYNGPILIQEGEYQAQLKEAIDLKDNLKFDKLSKNNPFKKSVVREWTESIVFAVFAASFIRMFLIEAYVIPTSSMEGSLNVGDYLFVSKAHYGIRTPMTLAMFPLIHNTIPFVGSESYLKKPSLNYHRLPAIENVEKGKPFVFNWPVGDSVYLTPTRSFFIRQVDQAAGMDPYLAKAVQDKDLRVRPIDKKDHYIKRCVATPGDTLEVRNRQIFINGVAQKNPKNIQYQYLVKSAGNAQFNQKKLSEWGISPEDVFQKEVINLDSAEYKTLKAAAPTISLKSIDGLTTGKSAYAMGNISDVNAFIKALDQNNLRANITSLNVMVLNQNQIDKLKAKDPNISLNIVPNSNVDSHFFPFNTAKFPWSMDNYGPIWMPKAGTTITLTSANIDLYTRIIGAYEGNDFKVVNGKFIINGKETNTYTFKQDYYWAMGDNRHMSEDSRMWGFVPADHIVGKPLFIWFSTREGDMKKGINWNRIFKSASAD